MSGRSRAVPVLGALLGAALLLALTAAAARVVDRPIEYFLRDAAATTGEPGYIGGLSSCGVLLAWGAGVCCLLAGALRRIGALLAVGALVCLLALDDLFLLHESFELAAAAIYGAGAVVIIARYRAYFARRDWLLLAAALGLLAVSGAADIVGELVDAENYVLEDGPKLLGLAALSAYLVVLAVEELASDSRPSPRP